MISVSSGQGRLLLVVGPSGAGKDTLLDHAKGELAGDERIRFVRRTITRPPSIGEDHEPMDATAFERAVDQRMFALHWQAHGLSYGLPTIIDEWLENGDTVVANGSRAIIPDARARYPDLEVVLITAAPEILAARLADRGRETKAGQKSRMARSAAFDASSSNTVTIDNSGLLEEAEHRLVALIKSGSADCPYQGQ